jgi:cobaltochelatase CobN
VVFTASGLYRDGMADKIVMLDRAARMAAAAGETLSAARIAR